MSREDKLTPEEQRQGVTLRKIGEILCFRVLVAMFFGVFFTSCKRDEVIITTTDYPKDIAYLMLSKCAISGCHNDASYEAAAHLNLSSWEKLFRGSSNGSTVIPYRSDFSSLLYYVNTYSDLGIVDQPTMPLHANPLTRDDVTRLKNWINIGAPNANGEIKFSDDPNRKKIYALNQGCRVVTVFDVATLLPMRYIDVADATEQNTSPHQIKISPDGKYWYVCFINGSYIKKFRTSDDGFEGKIFVGNAYWNTMAITPDSKFLFAVDWSINGKVVKCDVNSLTVVDSTNLGDEPHGSCIAPDGKHVFITATNGNYVYKISVDSLSQPLQDNNFVSLNKSPWTSTTSYNPHETVFSADGKKYFVSCSGTNNGGGGFPGVRIFDSKTDTLLAIVPMASGAYEMSISETKGMLFVSSYDGPVFNGFQGRITVINMNDNTWIKDISAGSQPHGLAVDDGTGLVYVANRNTNNPVPAHHSSVCGGTNGNVVFIDLNTLQLTGKRIEVSRDPYSLGIRF